MIGKKVWYNGGECRVEHVYSDGQRCMLLISDQWGTLHEQPAAQVQLVKLWYGEPTFPDIPGYKPEDN